ncbi:P-loop containing nucleoside triphosphate hydrolase protein, partial [Mycena amicta]
DSLRILAAGAVVEAIRRSCLWVYQRIKLRYSISAEFALGDPSYEWIVLFLTENKVWRASRDFRVTSKTSKLVYGVTVSADPEIQGCADYVPTYESPQLFRWRGYWVEVQRFQTLVRASNGHTQQTAAVFLTVFTRQISVLSELVEEAHRGYQRKTKPYIVQPSFGGTFFWNVKRIPHRPLESIILPDGVLDDLINDAKRFFASEDWYHRTGIPHRRGYLLYGEPGTGKSSTIHAVAGALNLEIYSFSLSSGFVDDSFLQRAVTTIPKRSILLLEDIDSILPSREEEESDSQDPPMRRSGVTLSGLLNIMDGIGSEEGKLFFATTNYIDRLDPALMRPGRIDRRIRYTLATRVQAQKLFERLFRDAEMDDVAIKGATFDDDPCRLSDAYLASLAVQFSDAMDDKEFSPAELQGYLLSNRERPVTAAAEMSAWVLQRRVERQEKEDEREERRVRRLARRARMQAQYDSPGGYVYGLAPGAPYPTPGTPPPPPQLLPSPPSPCPSPKSDPPVR